MTKLLDSANFIIAAAKRYGGEPRYPISDTNGDLLLYRFSNIRTLHKFQDIIMSMGLFANPSDTDPMVIEVRGD